MDPVVVGLLGIGLMLLLLLFGVHIALALGVSGLLGSIALNGVEATVWQSTSLIYNIVAAQDMVTLPLFIFMGILAGVGDISRNIYQALHAWVGRIRGGLGIATVLSCTAFGVCTGSSLVTAAVFSRICAPQMRDQGYDKKISYGICASAGSIGMLIPPSILLVVYGVISQQSVGKLLLAGVSPGILLAVFFSVGIYLLTYIRPHWFGRRDETQITWAKRFQSLLKIWPIILVALVVVGGIFLGIFSPTESASFGAATLLFLALYFTPRGARWSFLKKSVVETLVVSAMVFFIMSGAGLFARFLMYSDITGIVLDLVTQADFHPTSFILLVCFIYLIMGCFMDSISMISITLPILSPVVASLGINPIHFAMCAVMSIECGLVTPPVGLNVYASHGVAAKDVSLIDIFVGAFPFFLIMLLLTLCMIFFPVLSTFLPDNMFGM